MGGDWHCPSIISIVRWAWRWIARRNGWRSQRGTRCGCCDNARDIASQLPPPGNHGACFLTRSAQVTGEIQAHEMAWAGDELWLVNTLFSCLCTLHPPVQLRAPLANRRLSRSLAPEDRCHLNGLAMDERDNRSTSRRWRNPIRQEAGGPQGGDRLPDRRAIRAKRWPAGFAMPHSPRMHCGRCVAAGLGTRFPGDRGADRRQSPHGRPNFQATRAAWP